MSLQWCNPITQTGGQTGFHVVFVAVNKPRLYSIRSSLTVILEWLSFPAEGGSDAEFLYWLKPWSPQVDSRDWALNGNTISLDEDTVIDVPHPFDQVDRYCASLGHKANHSFTPNCKYDPWVQRDGSRARRRFMKVHMWWRALTGLHLSIIL